MEEQFQPDEDSVEAEPGQADNIDEPIEDTPEADPAKPARQQRSWLWSAMMFFGLFVIAPIIGCGALGFGIALATRGGPSSTPSPAVLSPSGDGTVAIIRVEGPIFAGESSPGGFAGASTVGSETVIRNLRSADDDPNIQAIVLRVNSPGGGVVASDEIYHAITQVEKPVVVSMGTVAASGGYYISAPTDYIYATPNTITGSIGVISQFVTAEELLDEFGVEVTNITTGEFKDAGTFSSTLTESEIEYWQELINESYDIFVEIVADGRGYTMEEALDLADGRVFTGSQALEVGLVDEIGYFEDAIAKAAELGGITGEPNTFEYFQEPSFIDILLGYQLAQSDMSLETIRELNTPTLEYRYLGPQ